MPVKQISDEIAYAQERVIEIDKAMLDAVKQKALATPRKRSRICAHKDPENPLHEMFIVHTKDAYVRPHKHLNKSESFYVIEGAVTVVMFTEEGDIETMARRWGDREAFMFDDRRWTYAAYSAT